MLYEIEKVSRTRERKRYKRGLFIINENILKYASQHQTKSVHFTLMYKNYTTRKKKLFKGATTYTHKKKQKVIRMYFIRN